MASLSKRSFGSLSSGQEAELWTLRNANGMEVEITDYGGIVVAIRVPDKAGKQGDVVLGFNTVQEYEKHSPYFGCITGRVANRIANAQFELDGVSYQLAANNGPNCLHGGVKGFDKVMWTVQPLNSATEVQEAVKLSQDNQEGSRAVDAVVGLLLKRTSVDMEEGFPGTLVTEVVYSLTKTNQLCIYYMATTDKPTLVNLCNHSYFNLNPAAPNCLDHVLQIYASHYTPMDDTSIPLGVLAPVEGTPFDFLNPKKVGVDIDAADEQLKKGQGYDHNFCLQKSSPGALDLAAALADPATGRTLRVYTTEPGVQLYTGNFLDGSFCGKTGSPVQHRAGLCLETQRYPDSIHHPDWPTTILRPEDTYRSTTIFEFGLTPTSVASTRH